MSKKEGDFTETISTCKKSRNTSWANGATRKCDAGMKMVVTVQGHGKNRTSKTSFEPR